MADARKIIVMVRAYNEVQMIRQTIAELLRSGYEVAVVDDGSTDGTWNAIQELPVHCVRHPINLGPGAAFQTIIEYALLAGAEVLVNFDADGQHRVEDIEVLLAPILAGDADVALGSRFLRAGDASSIPLVRRAVLQGARLVNFLFTGMWLTDAHNGLRVLTREAAHCLDLRETGFAYATEMLGQIRRHQLRCVECPTHIRYTEYSLGKGQRLSNALNVFLDLVVGRMVR
jgi:glycosyltransferase involved in cell wall biosynthesis